MIENYFLSLEQSIRELLNIRHLSLTKKIYNNPQGYINSSIIFDNHHRLDFVEVKNTELKSKIKYRYHYMDENQVMIFRYDNAPHHQEISTFPHHKHEVNEIKESREINLDEVLLEIAKKQHN
jgi:hypothetical protein